MAQMESNKEVNEDNDSKSAEAKASINPKKQKLFQWAQQNGIPKEWVQDFDSFETMAESYEDTKQGKMDFCSHFAISDIPKNRNAVSTLFIELRDHRQEYVNGLTIETHTSNNKNDINNENNENKESKEGSSYSFGNWLKKFGLFEYREVLEKNGFKSEEDIKHYGTLAEWLEWVVKDVKPSVGHRGRFRVAFESLNPQSNNIHEKPGNGGEGAQLVTSHSIIVKVNGGAGEQYTLYDGGRNTYLEQLKEKYSKHKFFVTTFAGAAEQLTSDVPLKILIDQKEKDDDVAEIEANTDDFCTLKKLKQEKYQCFDATKKKYGGVAYYALFGAYYIWRAFDFLILPFTFLFVSIIFSSKGFALGVGLIIVILIVESLLIYAKNNEIEFDFSGFADVGKLSVTVLGVVFRRWKLQLAGFLGKHSAMGAAVSPELQGSDTGLSLQLFIERRWYCLAAILGLPFLVLTSFVIAFYGYEFDLAVHFGLSYFRFDVFFCAAWYVAFHGTFWCIVFKNKFINCCPNSNVENLQSSLEMGQDTTNTRLASEPTHRTSTLPSQPSPIQIIE